MEQLKVRKEIGMKFSIIVVALNPGEKLEKTLKSIFSQTCTDYEIILKDGGSRDGSMEAWRCRLLTIMPFWIWQHNTEGMTITL